MLNVDFFFLCLHLTSSVVVDLVFWLFEYEVTLFSDCTLILSYSDCTRPLLHGGLVSDVKIVTVNSGVT